VIAVVVGAIAVAIVLRRDQAERLDQPNVETVEITAAAAPVVEPAPAPGTWSLRASGWYIRVDGAEVDIVSVEEQTKSPPGASLAVSISPFDQLIVHHAKAEGFDWRLIAALIFEESRFNPSSRSERGAYGLMQVRPIAAEAVGAERFTAPYDNVQTGVRYLRQLEGTFGEAHGRDRLGIVLAAYNVGPAHVRDAQLLARRFGYNPNRWHDHVELMLPLLEQPAIYEELPWGYARGNDAVTYVKRILARYERYQRELPLGDGEALSSTAPASSNG
jgi:soluble lytic murein transglycosylase-like protein